MSEVTGEDTRKGRARRDAGHASALISLAPAKRETRGTSCRAGPRVNARRTREGTRGPGRGRCGELPRDLVRGILKSRNLGSYLRASVRAS